MVFEDFQTKDSVVIVYTGDGKGKTTASLGLMVRALGNRWNVAFIQFIKHWGVNEHVFMRDIMSIYKDQLSFIRGGKGFYKAGELSELHISEDQHKKAAKATYDEAFKAVSSGKYNLVICDEINNAVHDGLITVRQLERLIDARTDTTNLCLTGRHFPASLIKKADIVTEMKKVKHHFDDKYLANKGIDF